MSFSQSPEYLGDVDLPGVTGGGCSCCACTRRAPCCRSATRTRPRAIGEITGAAIEIEAEAEL